MGKEGKQLVAMQTSSVSVRYIHALQELGYVPVFLASPSPQGDIFTPGGTTLPPIETSSAAGGH